MTAVAPLKRFVDPARPITYGIVQAGEDVDGGIPYIRPVDMPLFARDLDPATLRTTTPEIAAAYERSTVRAGDLVVSIGPSYGKLLIISPRLSRANLTQGTARVAPARGVDVRFLQWSLASASARAHWDAAIGGATFGGLNLGPLSMTPVPSLALAEQRRIADFLDRECTRIDDALDELAALEALVKQAETELLDSVLPDGPRMRLGWVARVQTGLTLGKTYDEQELVTLPYLRVANVQSDRIDLTELKEVALPRSDIDSCLLVPGDVLMTEGGDIDKLGRGAVWHGEVVPCLHQNHVFAVRLDPAILLPDYLALVTRSTLARTYFESTAVRSTNLASTSSTKVRAFRLPVPSVHEQKQVVEEFAARSRPMRASRAELDGVAAVLREYRDALITEAITGQLDLGRLNNSQVVDRIDAIRRGEQSLVVTGT